MSVFRTEKVLWASTPQLQAVTDDVVRQFRAQRYDARPIPSGTGSWEVKLVQGGTAHAVVGLRTAVDLQITPENGGTRIEASAGMLGRQLVPLALTIALGWLTLYLVFPLIAIQIWGLVKQAKLDNAAAAAAEDSLLRWAHGQQSHGHQSPGHPGAPPIPPAPGPTPPWVSYVDAPTDRYQYADAGRSGHCRQCSGPLAPSAAYCPTCGAQQG